MNEDKSNSFVNRQKPSTFNDTKEIEVVNGIVFSQSVTDLVAIGSSSLEEVDGFTCFSI